MSSVSNIELLGEGLVWGLTLSLMIGPILLTLIQTGIEKGLRAGVLVGSGIWMSDIIIIALMLYVSTSLKQVDLEGSFKLYFGIIGGIVLIVFGLATMVKKPVNLEIVPVFTSKNIAGYWLKGFLVNTINPFTFIFWMTLVISYNVAQQIGTQGSIIFYGAILMTIMFFNVLQVWAAKSIRQKLTPKRIHAIGKVTGLALLLFGVLLIIRSI